MLRLQLKEGTFPAGTYVVRLDQPYRNYAVDLLTPQHYPKMERRPTMTFPGSCPLTITCRRSPLPMPQFGTPS